MNKLHTALLRVVKTVTPKSFIFAEKLLCRKGYLWATTKYAAYRAPLEFEDKSLEGLVAVADMPVKVANPVEVPLHDDDARYYPDVEALWDLKETATYTVYLSVENIFLLAGVLRDAKIAKGEAIEFRFEDSTHPVFIRHATSGLEAAIMPMTK